jgi:tagatose 1,6-diphosphate aldolase
MIRLSEPVKTAGNEKKGWVSTHTFTMLDETGQPVGEIALRLGHTEWVVQYAGHVGYHVNAPFQGRGYATQACLLLRPLAVNEGFTELWITCNPDNWASRRVCEKIGAVLVNIVDLPPGNEMYERGERQKCRYLWKI